MNTSALSAIGDIRILLIAAAGRDSLCSVEDLGRPFKIGKRKAARLAEFRTLVARKVHGSDFLLFMVADNPGAFPPRRAVEEARSCSGPKVPPEGLSILK